MSKPLQLRFFFLLLSFFIYLTNFAQERYSIKGVLQDTAEKKGLYQASISLLKAADSTLLTYTRSDKEGFFKINNLPAGKFIILASYPGYAVLIDTFRIQLQDLNLGNLTMSTRIKVLEDIVLKNKVAAIRIKGDTTEYAADSFKVAPNADVQELLRSMPDFQINAKGEIITQGEKVNKVLVDGEEFFSDDPAVVTKNLRADAVDKVQVFDKKSDQAVFTGIDDGQRSKTINLKLKEDKTRGYFGKAESGTNLNSLYTGKMMANLFRGKKKMAGYFTTDNTRFEGLNWDDQRNYGDGGNITTEILEGGGISVSVTSDDDYSENRGLPNQRTAGALWANKKGNTSLSNAGQYQHLGTESNGTTHIRTLLAGTTQLTNSADMQQMNKRRYKFNSTNQWGTDSTGLFKAVVRGSNKKKEADADYSAATLRENGSMLNTSSRTRSYQNEENGLDANISYRRKLAKKGRTISLVSSLTVNQMEEKGTLIADNLFYDLGGINTSREHIDQQKISDQWSTEFKVGMNYTEPVGKKGFLVFQYNLGLGRNEADRNTLGKGSGGLYVDPIDSLSNHFVFASSQNSGSLNYRFVTKKINLSLGSGLGRSLYQLNDIIAHSNRRIGFNNFLPAASFTWTPAPQKRISLTYNGTTSNPQLTQLQPLKDNTDPLNLTIGNPFLKQGFTHYFNIGGNSYKVLKNRYIGLGGFFSLRDNGVSTHTQIDMNGRRTTQYINVNGAFNGNMNMVYGKKLYKSLNGGLRLVYTLGRNISYINSVQNITDYKGINYSVEFSIWGDKWFTFQTSLGARKNFTKSSIYKAFDGNYWSYMWWGNAKIKLKKAKLYLDLEPSLEAYQKTAAFPESRNSFLLNPTLRKTFGKADAWEAKVFVYDLLNKVQEASRAVSTNFLTASTSNTLHRYVLIGLIYNFSKNGKPTTSGF